MPRMKVHPLCGWAALRCLLVLMLLATDAPGKPLWAQSAGSAPTYQSCASSAVRFGSFSRLLPPRVEQTLTALYKPAARVHRHALRAPRLLAECSGKLHVGDLRRGQTKFPISEVDIYQTANNGTVVLSHGQRRCQDDHGHWTSDEHDSCKLRRVVLARSSWLSYQRASRSPDRRLERSLRNTNRFTTTPQMMRCTER